jgi:hypothetical protein
MCIHYSRGLQGQNAISVVLSGTTSSRAMELESFAYLDVSEPKKKCPLRNINAVINNNYS